MIRGSAAIWGLHCRPYTSPETETTVSVEGMLRDRVGPVVTFGDRLDILSGFRIELGSLADDHDPPWSLDNT